MIQGGDPTGTGRGGSSIYGYVNIISLILSKEKEGGVL